MKRARKHEVRDLNKKTNGPLETKLVIKFQIDGMRDVDDAVSPGNRTRDLDL